MARKKISAGLVIQYLEVNEKYKKKSEVLTEYMYNI